MRSGRIKGGISLIASLLGISSLFIASLGMAAAAPAPSQVYVSTKNCSNSGPGTNQKPYCTVQEGVNAVAPGGTVFISNGTYAEAVTIPVAKSNITLRGNGKNTVIQAPSSFTNGGIIVDISAKNVTLSDLSVSGPFPAAGCNDNEYGVYLENGSSANISDSWVVNVIDSNSALYGCQQGVAVEVGNSSTSDAATATISDSVVSGYQKNGITVDGTGSKANISDNNIVGGGAGSAVSDITAQNGVQISDGATGSVTDNSVTNNEYTPPTSNAYTAAGILIYDSSHVTVSDNVVNRNDVGIYLGSDGTLPTVSNSVSQNSVNNSTTNGIYLEPATSGNHITQNTAHGTTGSTFYTPYDAEDDSTGTGTLHTANFWSQNSCKTSDPAGLCKV